MALISCKNITKTYPVGFSGRRKKTALDQLSFDVEPNDVFGIIGPNGAGKSTILKILMGFVRADNGTALLDGKKVSNYLCHQRLGYLPENPSLYSQLSLRDHLLFAGRLAKMERSLLNTRIKELVEMVGLSHVVNVPVKNFSKGMTQRAALAYALLLKPEILILDEPMSGLDPFGRQLVVDIIEEYHEKGTTILLCSHILTDVERICTKIAIMDRGELVAETIPPELRTTNVIHEGMTPLESFFFETIKSRKQ